MTANDAKLYLTDLWESDWTSVDETIALEMAIKALTAIDDIKAEIASTLNSEYCASSNKVIVNRIFAIIDKHISGKENKE